MSSPQCVGEVDFCEMRPTSFAVYAQEKSVIYKLTRKEYEGALAHHKCAAIPLLRGVRTSELLQVGRFVKYRSNENIFVYGHAATHFYVILDGKIDVNGKILSMNQYFGHETLLGLGTWSKLENRWVQSKENFAYSAKALEDTLLWVLEREAFLSHTFESVRVVVEEVWAQEHEDVTASQLPSMTTQMPPRDDEVTVRIRIPLASRSAPQLSPSSSWTDMVPFSCGTCHPLATFQTHDNGGNAMPMAYDDTQHRSPLDLVPPPLPSPWSTNDSAQEWREVLALDPLKWFGIEEGEEKVSRTIINSEHETFTWRPPSPKRSSPQTQAPLSVDEFLSHLIRPSSAPQTPPSPSALPEAVEVYAPSRLPRAQHLDAMGPQRVPSIPTPVRPHSSRHHLRRDEEVVRRRGRVGGVARAPLSVDTPTDSTLAPTDPPTVGVAVPIPLGVSLRGDFASISVVDAVPVVHAAEAVYV